MSFGMRLRREFQHPLRADRHIYPKLAVPQGRSTRHHGVVLLPEGHREISQRGGDDAERLGED